MCAYLHLCFFHIILFRDPHCCIQIGVLLSECTGTLQVLPTRNSSTNCSPIGQGIFPGASPESDSSSMKMQSTEGTVCWDNASMFDSPKCLHCMFF